MTLTVSLLRIAPSACHLWSQAAGECLSDGKAPDVTSSGSENLVWTIPGCLLAWPGLSSLSAPQQSRTGSPVLTQEEID